MEYDNKIDAALTQHETINEIGSLVTLSTGVVLKFKNVPILTIQTIVKKFELPKPPKTYNESKGRWEENINDPTFLKMIEQIETQRTLAVVDAIIALGTEVVNPSDVIPLEDDEWIENLAVVGIELVISNKLSRYLHWVKHVAIKDTSDLEKITEQFGLTMGVSEKGISDQMVTNFPGNS